MNDISSGSFRDCAKVVLKPELPTCDSCDGECDSLQKVMTEAGDERAAFCCKCVGKCVSEDWLMCGECEKREGH